MKEEIRLKLLDKAKNISQDPGVYRMLDKHAKVIYVGKAKKLSNRVRSYFQATSDPHLKTQALLKRVQDFDIIITDSEAEALILECILIKKHKPRYNVMFKDDKSYPYLIIDYKHSFPKLIYTRRVPKKKEIKVLGPYASPGALRQAMRFLNHSFQLRDCSDLEFSNRSRPCMNFQIGQCSAPCTNEITQKEYIEDLDKAISILEGKSTDVINQLTNEMQKHSENMDYELAARSRDQVKSLEGLLQEGEQKVSTNSKNKLDRFDKDVFGLYRKQDTICFTILFIRAGKLIDSTSFYFEGVSEEDSDTELLSQFVAQYYLTKEFLPGEAEAEQSRHYIPGTELKMIPAEIILPLETAESKLLEASLKKLGFGSAKLVWPQKSTKQEMVELANNNAIESYAIHKKEKGNVYRALAHIKSRLRLQNYPRRMECYDISNLGDSGIVASRVVFIEGRADKNLYRRYKMKSVHSQNDFAAMKEVLTRRLMKDDPEDAPDLIIVDGGKGQLSIASEVFKELDITGIDLISLAKSKTKSNFQSQEIEKSNERVFKPGRMNPITLAADSMSSFLLQRIRDEAHRFAVEFQRKQRKIK